MSEKLFADIAVFRENGVPENVVKQYVQDYGLGIKKKKEATLETYSPPNYSKGVSNVPLPVGSADFGKKSDLVEKLFKRDKTNKTKPK